MTAVYRICVALAMILLVDSTTGDSTEQDSAAGAPTAAAATTSSAAPVVTTAVTQAPPCNALAIENCANCSGDAQTPVCVECNAFYGLWNTTTCLLCNSTIPHCSTCSNSTACTSCSAGYGLNSTSKQCQECPLGCDRCSNLISCDAGGCAADFYFNASQCNAQLKCNISIANCIWCNDVAPGKNGTCETCDAGKGFFLADDNTHCKVCKEAIHNCEKCNKASAIGEHPTCEKCDDGYGQKNANKACDVCSEAAEVSAHCVQCTLDGDPQCTKCNDTYGLNTTSFVCTECPVLIPNCDLCTNNAQKCTRCAATFRPTELADQCEACGVANCNNCTTPAKGQCDYGGCQSGHFLNENKKCSVASECNTKIANCVTCVSITINNPNVNCSQCMEKFAVDASGTVCTAEETSLCSSGSGFDAASFVGGIVLGCGVIIIIVVVSWYCRKGRTGALSYSQF